MIPCCAVFGSLSLCVSLLDSNRLQQHGFDWQNIFWTFHAI